VLSVTDALLLAQNADAALLVVAARRTRKDVILRALQTLKRSGVDIIGAVLNMVRQSDLGYYYSHYYYGYYYASPDEVPGEIVLVGRMAQDADAAQERKG
jgi:Mrp family chromosome partitioning ATPase